jgi:hypothetical protein
MTAKKVTEKTTKKEMLVVIQTMQQELEQERERNGVDKKTELKLVEENSTVQSASKTSVEEIIKTFRVQINESLSGFEEQLLTKKSKLDEIQAAIQIEEQRLKDVFEVQLQSDTLQALLRAQEKETEEFEKTKDTAATEWNQEQEDHDKWVQEREALTKKEWDRKTEESRYDWKIKQDRQVDDFKELKRLKERELKELEEITTKSLNTREDAIKEQETDIAELKKKVSEIEANEAAAVQTAVDKALKSEKASRHFEVSSLKKDHESSEIIKSKEIETLTASVKDLSANNTDLRTKLEAAYTEIRNIAKDAIQGASQAKVILNQDSKAMVK